jgi:hypothetical protein
MTNQQHPITPPPELAQEWVLEAHHKEAPPGTCPDTRILIARAAQWGADMELEACCEWLTEYRYSHLCNIYHLRAARRPKPPSLKVQALEELEQLRGDSNSMGMGFDASAIQRALESLPND